MTSSFLLSLYQVDLRKNWLTSQNKHIEWKFVQFVIPVLSGNAPPYTWLHFNLYLNESYIHVSSSHPWLSLMSTCLWSYKKSAISCAAHNGSSNKKPLLWARHLAFGQLPGSKWDNAHPETIAFPPYTEESYDLFLRLQDQHQHKTIRNSPVSKPCNHTWGLLSLP